MRRPADSSDSFDYIIVGAGSAGCVVANRLTEHGDASVLILEAGPRDLSPAIHVPAGLLRLDPEKLYWRYQIEPDPSRKNRRGVWAAPGGPGGGGPGQAGVVGA